MILGIDASRANAVSKTGTEWYAYHVITRVLRKVPKNITIHLYFKDKPQEGFKVFDQQARIRILRWPPKYLWTHLRLSGEMLLAAPDALFVPAHTIPLLHPKKVVTTIHDIGFEYEHDLYNNARIGSRNSFAAQVLNTATRAVTLGEYGSNERDYHKFSVRQAVHHATKIITPSSFTKKEMVEHYGIDPQRICVIPLAHDDAIFHPRRDGLQERAIREKYHIGNRYLITVGRIEHKKNSPRLVRAFARLRAQRQYHDLQLVLVGNPGYGSEDVRLSIARNKLIESVRITGWIPTEEYAHLLRASSGFVFPSLYEGFGIPPLEAMASGVPVLTSQRASMPEVCGDAALYINPDNEDDIEGGLRRLIDSDTGALIQRGVARAQLFSWDNTANKTLDVLLEVIKTRQK